MAHVLEQLPTAADGKRALTELHRVAVWVYVCSPSPAGLINWLVPGHHLWVYQASDGTISFEQRHRGEQADEWWYPLLQAYWELKDELEVRLAVG